MENLKTLLKIMVYSDQKSGGIALYEQIVLKAKELGLVGVTVVKGAQGFIGNDVIHKPSLSRFSESLPVTIEVIDTEENINKLLPFLDGAIRDGLVMTLPILKH